jgi:hypothetical protein
VALVAEKSRQRDDLDRRGRKPARNALTSAGNAGDVEVRQEIVDPLRVRLRDNCGNLNVVGSGDIILPRKEVTTDRLGVEISYS